METKINQLDEPFNSGPPVRQPASVPDNGLNREAGDDALSEDTIYRRDADEQVIVNEQRGDRTVNIPSQTAANPSEEMGSDDDLINGR